VYAITSPINGYFGGSLYARMGGKIWIKQMTISAFMLPAFVCGTAFFINFIAIYYHASRAIPFGTMVINKQMNVRAYNVFNNVILGCSNLHMFIYNFAIDSSGNCVGT
jgi:hypothetical protein